MASCSASSGRSGRGPTMLMSPISTFKNWGSSSSRVRRKNLPTRVMRGSPAVATTIPVSLSASGFIDRNFSIENSRNRGRGAPPVGPSTLSS